MNYCTKCGAKLQEGVSCVCSQTESTPPEQAQNQQQPTCNPYGNQPYGQQPTFYGQPYYYPCTPVKEHGKIFILIVGILMTMSGCLGLIINALAFDYVLQEMKEMEMLYIFELFTVLCVIAFGIMAICLARHKKRAPIVIFLGALLVALKIIVLYGYFCVSGKFLTLRQ